MVTSLFMSYTSPYTVNQPLNQNMVPQQLTTLDDNQEQLRQIVREEQQKTNWKCCCKYFCIIYWTIQIISLIIVALTQLTK